MVAEFGRHNGWIFIGIGVCEILWSFTAKNLIGECGPPPTKQERTAAKATPRKRVIGVVFGLAVLIAGIILLAT